MRERAVILLYTETYLVLVKEPSCSPLPIPPHSPCFPTQTSRFQPAAPCDWGQHRRDCNPARGGCSLSLTLFISLFISYFSIYFPIYFSVLKRCKPDTHRRHRLRGFFLLSPTAFLLSSLSFLPPSKHWSLGTGSPLAAPSGEDKHSWRG